MPFKQSLCLSPKLAPGFIKFPVEVFLNKITFQLKLKKK